jgi:ketosteroid isomerase-like protein
MDQDERLRIERACERLVTLYCHHVDHGEAARVAELFTDDGVWHSPEVTMDGVDQIRKGFTVRQNRTERMSRHVCNNALIDVIDADNAEGCVYLTLYNFDGDPDRKISPLEGARLVGEYRDKFRRTREGWRISRRDIYVSFLRDAKA